MASKAKQKLTQIIDDPQIAIKDFCDLGDYLANEDMSLFNTLMSNDKLSQEIFDYLDAKNENSENQD